MSDFHIEFDIKPFPKERPRATKNGRVFTPNKTINYEKQLRNLFLEQVDENFEPFDGPISVKIDIAVDKVSISVTAVDHKPKGMRGDLDNYIKAALDALNGFAWEDDRQIVHLDARKVGP